MKELIELERWRRRNNYEPDQPYLPPSFREFLDGLDEKSLLAYVEWQAELKTEIDRLEGKYGEA